MVGTREAVAAARAHPLARALRLDKLSLAALEATLRALPRPDARAEIPVLAMLTADERDAARRAPSGSPTGIGEVVEGVREGRRRRAAAARAARPGRGARPARRTSSPPACERADPPVVGRIQDGRLLLDPRTLADDEIELAARAVRDRAAVSARLLESAQVRRVRAGDRRGHPRGARQRASKPRPTSRSGRSAPSARRPRGRRPSSVEVARLETAADAADAQAEQAEDARQAAAGASHWTASASRAPQMPDPAPRSAAGAAAGCRLLAFALLDAASRALVVGAGSRSSIGSVDDRHVPSTRRRSRGLKVVPATPPARAAQGPRGRARSCARPTSPPRCEAARPERPPDEPARSRPSGSTRSC